MAPLARMLRPNGAALQVAFDGGEHERAGRPDFGLLEHDVVFDDHGFGARKLFRSFDDVPRDPGDHRNEVR